MIPRWLHRLYAAVAGYFWKPCPRCGRMFGGHESGGTLWTSAGVGWITCSNCPGDYGVPQSIREAVARPDYDPHLDYPERYREGPV